MTTELDILTLACKLAEELQQRRAMSGLSAQEHDLVRALGNYFRQQGIEAARTAGPQEEGESYDR